MNEPLIVGIIVVVIVVGAILAKKYLLAKPYWFRNPMDRGFDTLKEVKPVLTAKGIEVYYEPGAERIDHDACDRGWERVTARVACRYPYDPARHVARKIVVLKGEIAPESGIPAFRVAINHSTPYFNSEWDMMKGNKRGIHYVLAAGQMMGADYQKGDSILIPDSGSSTFYENITDFEWEHIYLAYYDGDEFNRTKVHDGTSGHPVIGPCPGTESLTTELPSTFLCLGVTK